MSNGITLSKMGYARYEIDPHKTGNILVPSDWTVQDVNEYKAINFKFTYEWTDSNKCEIKDISWYPVKLEIDNGQRVVVNTEFVENSPFMKGKSDGANLSIKFKDTEIIDQNDNFSLEQQDPLYTSGLTLTGITSKYFTCNFLYSYEEQIQIENDNNDYATIRYFIKIDNIKIPKTSKYEHNVIFTEEGISELIDNIKKYPVTDIETIESNDEDNNGNNIWEYYTEGQPCIKIKYGDSEKEFFYDENEFIKTKGYKYVKVGSNIKFKDADGNNIDALVVEDVDQSLGTFRVQINNEIFEVPIAGFYSGDDSLKIDGHLYPAKDDKYNIGKIEAINYEEASEYDPDKTYYVSDGYTMVDNIEDGQTFYEPTYKYVRATEYNENEEYYEGISPVQATEYDSNTQYYEYNYSVFDSHAESIKEVGFNPLQHIKIAPPSAEGDESEPSWQNLTETVESGEEEETTESGESPEGTTDSIDYEFYTDDSHWFLLLKEDCQLKFDKALENVEMAALGGGGGGGSNDESGNYTAGGGGGAGGNLVRKTSNINEFTKINISIGEGGSKFSTGGTSNIVLNGSTFIDSSSSLDATGGGAGSSGQVANHSGGDGGTNNMPSGIGKGGKGGYSGGNGKDGDSGSALFSSSVFVDETLSLKDIILVGPGGGGGRGKFSDTSIGSNGSAGIGLYGIGGLGGSDNRGVTSGTSGIVALRGSCDSSSSTIDIVNFPADETYYIYQNNNYVEADPQPTAENYQEDIDYYVRTLDEVNSNDIDTSDMSQYYMFSGYEIADPQPSAAEYYKYYIKIQDSYKKYEPIYEYRKATQYSKDETYYEPISFIQASTYDNEKSYYEETYTEFNNQSSDSTEFIENETYYIQQNDSYVEADPQPTVETISQNTYYIKAYNEINNNLINQENVSQYFIPNEYQEIINSIAQQDIQKYYTREFIGYSRDGESSDSSNGYYIQIFKKADPQPNEENFNNENYYVQSTDSLRWKNINISGDIYMTDSQSIFSLKGGEVGQFLCGNGKDNNPIWSNYYNGKFYVTDGTDAKRYNGDTYESISANELIENNLLTIVVQHGTCTITPSQLSQGDITYRIEPSGTVEINAIIYLFEIKDSGTTRTSGRLRDSVFKNHLEQLGFNIGEPVITSEIYKFNSQYNANKYYIYENNKYIQCEENKNYPNTIFYYVKDTNDPAVGLGENDATVEGSITTLGGIAARKSIKGYKVHGAVFNDYAEYRHTDSLMPGCCVIETGRGDLILSTSRLQLGANIISDTFGFSIGESSYANTPIAVCGRVLAYPYEDINVYQPGDAVCSGPNGTISKMTRKEIQEWPDAIIGTVSEIPQYEVWGSDAIKVDGRIWIKVK